MFQGLDQHHHGALAIWARLACRLGGLTRYLLETRCHLREPLARFLRVLAILVAAVRAQSSPIGRLPLSNSWSGKRTVRLPQPWFHHGQERRNRPRKPQQRNRSARRENGMVDANRRMCRCADDADPGILGRRAAVGKAFKRDMLRVDRAQRAGAVRGSATDQDHHVRAAPAGASAGSVRHGPAVRQLGERDRHAC